MSVKKAVDVSYHNGVIDFEKVKNDLKPRKDSTLRVKNIREAALRERELVGAR